MSPEQAKQLAKERLGETTINCQGELMTIIAYRSYADIDIQYLETGSVRLHQRYDNFRKGLLRDYWLPTVYGVGILEDGKIYDENKKKKISFLYWESMIRRCYSKNNAAQYTSLKNCSVCEEWLHFPVFEKWFDENYYKCGEERMCLSKDILIPGNTIYSPKTVFFVPERINNFFTKSDAQRGLYPIGVHYNKISNRFVAQMSALENEERNTKYQTNLGSFKTPEEVFTAYKTAKESYTKEIADYYLKKYPNFPRKLYDVLYNYQVQITD